MLGSMICWLVKNLMNRICQSISQKRFSFDGWSITVYIQNVLLLFPLLCNESVTWPDDSEIFLRHFHLGWNRKLHSTERLWSKPFYSTIRVTTSWTAMATERTLSLTESNRNRRRRSLFQCHATFFGTQIAFWALKGNVIFFGRIGLKVMCNNVCFVTWARVICQIVLP